MDINQYIDDAIAFLFQNRIYDVNDIDENKRIENKVRRLKMIASTDSEYREMALEEKKAIIDSIINDILNKNAALSENNDPTRKKYANPEGQLGYGKTLLEKQSITTGEDLEISYCTIGKGSIHLHCGISRKIDYFDSNGKAITHYHALLRNLKKYFSEKYNIHEKSKIEKICYEQIIRPYIIETLKNAVTLCENYPNLKTIRLDTNDGFFKQIYPTLHEFGFEIIDKDDEFHMEELSLEFPQYTFPDDLEKFYQDYPDRKNSVTIHTADLKNNLDKIATLSVNNFSSKSI